MANITPNNSQRFLKCRNLYCVYIVYSRIFAFSVLLKILLICTKIIEQNCGKIWDFIMQEVSCYFEVKCFHCWWLSFSFPVDSVLLNVGQGLVCHMYRIELIAVFSKHGQAWKSCRLASCFLEEANVCRHPVRLLAIKQWHILTYQVSKEVHWDERR